MGGWVGVSRSNRRTHLLCCCRHQQWPKNSPNYYINCNARFQLQLPWLSGRERREREDLGDICRVYQHAVGVHRWLLVLSNWYNVSTFSWVAVAVVLVVAHLMSELSTGLVARWWWWAAEKVDSSVRALMQYRSTRIRTRIAFAIGTEPRVIIIIIEAKRASSH